MRGAVRSVVPENSSLSAMETVAVGSIGPSTDWSEALDGIDTVVHLAAAVPKPGDASNRADDFHTVNVLGSKHLAESAAAEGIKRLVFMSSIEVNGIVSYGRPFSEDDEPNPQSSYGESKLEAERELLRTAGDTGLEVVIIRPPFIYGPGKLGSLMGLAKSLVEKGVPLPVASIDNHYSFIYIENLLDVIMTCCISPKAAGQIFLVSDGLAVSTPDLIRIIAGETNRKARLFPLPYALLSIAGKVMGKSKALKLLTDSYYVDSSKIRGVLGWKAPYSFREGMSATISPV